VTSIPYWLAITCQSTLCEASSEELGTRPHITSTRHCMNVLPDRGTISTNTVRQHREQRQCWPGRQAHGHYCEMGVWLLPLYVLPPVPNTFIDLANRVSLRSSSERDHGAQRTQLSGQVCVHFLFRRQLVAQNEGLHVANRKRNNMRSFFLWAGGRLIPIDSPCELSNNMNRMTVGRRQAHTHEDNI
jgi:hypothetical protein